MKKFLYTLCFAILATFAVSACADEDIRPQDGTTNDPCVFGGAGCPPR
jgi:hypothetical protein